MTEFETKLLETLEAIQTDNEAQSKAIGELQTAVGTLHSDWNAFYERMAEDAGTNFREHREFKRRIEALEKAVGITPSGSEGAEPTKREHPRQ